MKYFILILFNFNFFSKDIEIIQTNNNLIEEEKAEEKVEVEIEDEFIIKRFVVKHKKKIITFGGIVCFVAGGVMFKKFFLDERDLKEDRDYRSNLAGGDISQIYSVEENVLQMPYKDDIASKIYDKDKNFAGESLFHNMHSQFFAPKAKQTKKSYFVGLEKEYFKYASEDEQFNMIHEDKIYNSKINEKYFKSIPEEELFNMIHENKVYNNLQSHLSPLYFDFDIQNRCFVNKLTKYRFYENDLNFDYKDKDLDINKKNFNKFKQFESYVKSFGAIVEQEKLIGVKYPSDDFVPPCGDKFFTLKQIHDVYSLNYYPGDNSIYGIIGPYYVVPLEQMDDMFLC